MKNSVSEAENFAVADEELPMTKTPGILSSIAFQILPAFDGYCKNLPYRKMLCTCDENGMELTLDYTNVVTRHPQAKYLLVDLVRRPHSET